MWYHSADSMFCSFQQLLSNLISGLINASSCVVHSKRFDELDRCHIQQVADQVHCCSCTLIESCYRSRFIIYTNCRHGHTNTGLTETVLCCWNSCVLIRDHKLTHAQCFCCNGLVKHDIRTEYPCSSFNSNATDHKASTSCTLHFCKTTICSLEA